MNKWIILGGVAMLTLQITACAPIPLQPGAEKVMITPDETPKHCKFLGVVTANQGGYFSGAWTSNQNLQQGSFNDLRNKAAQMGGNRVVPLMQTAGMTQRGFRDGTFGGGETNVAVTANVFRCPHQ